MSEKLTLKELKNKMGRGAVKKLSEQSGLSIRTIYEHMNGKAYPHENNVKFYKSLGVTEFD